MIISKAGLYQLTRTYHKVPKGCFLSIVHLNSSGMLRCTLFIDYLGREVPAVLVKEY